jgi:hypothetical protein
MENSYVYAVEEDIHYEAQHVVAVFQHQCDAETYAQKRASKYAGRRGVSYGVYKIQVLHGPLTTGHPPLRETVAEYGDIDDDSK